MAPKQKPGKSRQDYGTPPAFLEALKRRLCIEEFSIDLAASEGNAVAHNYYTEATDALSPDIIWNPYDGWAFCNPPYSHITPWVEKASEEFVNRGAKVAMLVPAAVGANWWYNYVDGIASVLFLNGRLTFVGETAPYPKDCAILLYQPYVRGGSYECWNWRD